MENLFSLEYILLIMAHLAVLTFVSYKISQLRNRREGSDDDDDGGIGFDLKPPTLDLPPGVTLPIDTPEELETA